MIRLAITPDLFDPNIINISYSLLIDDEEEITVQTTADNLNEGKKACLHKLLDTLISKTAGSRVRYLNNLNRLNSPAQLSESTRKKLRQLDYYCRQFHIHQLLSHKIEVAITLILPLYLSLLPGEQHPHYKSLAKKYEYAEKFLLSFRLQLYQALNNSDIIPNSTEPVK